MSRRSHHPIKRHVRPRHPEAKRAAQTPDRPGPDPEAIDPSTAAEPPEPPLGLLEPALPDVPAPSDEPDPTSEATPDPTIDDQAAGSAGPAIDASTDASATVPESEPVAPRTPDVDDGMPAARPALPAPHPATPVGPAGAATAPQLRRFIKSRSYIPMHELRRRFGISIEDDDVAAIDLPGHRVFVGLPQREGELLGELLRAGDIGYEVSFDPVTPVIVGVFPIRPVTRG